MNKLREIRLSPEWGVHYPIWESGSEKYILSPEDLRLSENLARRLRDWNEFWQSHHVGENYEWDSETSRLEFEAEGDAIARELQEEIRNFAVVISQFRSTEEPGTHPIELTSRLSELPNDLRRRLSALAKFQKDHVVRDDEGARWDTPNSRRTFEAMSSALGPELARVAEGLKNRRHS